MNRRDCLKTLAAGTLGSRLATAAAPLVPAAKLTPPEEVMRRVREAQPLLGGRIPADFAQRLGATHYAGKYHLTKEPFLIEGCKALLNLGMRVAKFWFGPDLNGYNYNSTWNWKPGMRLVDVAQHPYFVQAFAMPFSTFVLEIQPVNRGGKHFMHPANDYAADEEELGELAAHLLKTYADRDVTFILQHWEGDWMLRGKPGADWSNERPPDIDARCASFTRWLAARQRGAERARKEGGPSQCKVLHAAEVNRVLDLLKGIPTLTSHVLPHVDLDLVSWSSYDGMGNAVNTWHGIELIRHYARPSPVFKRPMVYIGEVGLPERGKSEAEVVAWWDRAMGVFLAQEIPWILHWELYCNEPNDKAATAKQSVLTADEVRGFWLLRPDGSLSHSGKYLKTLLDQSQAPTTKKGPA